MNLDKIFYPAQRGGFAFVGYILGAVVLAGILLAMIQLSDLRQTTNDPLEAEVNKLFAQHERLYAAAITCITNYPQGNPNSGELYPTLKTDPGFGMIGGGCSYNPITGEFDCGGGGSGPTQLWQCPGKAYQLSAKDFDDLIFIHGCIGDCFTQSALFSAADMEFFKIDTGIGRTIFFPRIGWNVQENFISTTKSLQYQRPLSEPYIYGPVLILQYTQSDFRGGGGGPRGGGGRISIDTGPFMKLINQKFGDRKVVIDLNSNIAGFQSLSIISMLPGSYINPYMR